MNQWMSLERVVATLMADEAAGTSASAEQLSDQIITATGRQRPAPRWLALLQESSMSAQSRVVVGSPALRLGLVALLLLALTIAGVTVGALLINRPSSLPFEWSGFRGGPTHDGVATNGPVGNPVPRWQVRMDPIDTFVSLSGGAILVTDSGTLRAIEAATGSDRWDFHADSPLGEATVADGLAYAIDRSGVLHVIDVATGSERWKSAVTTDTRHLVDGLSAPTVAGDAIYVLAGDGRVFALDRETGDVRWDVPIPNGFGTNSPSVADGLVYVGGEGFVEALHAADGKTAWTFDTHHVGPMGTVVVADGVAYAGDGGGSLHALNARTGDPLWTVDEPLFAPAVAGPIAVSSSQFGAVVGLDTTTGKYLWHYQMSGASRPASIADGVAYIAAETGRRVYALDVETGEERWHFDIDGDVACCLGVGDGLVVVPTTMGSLYAIGGDGQAIKPKP